MPALIAWWTQDVSVLAPDADPALVWGVGADLLARWREPHRAYHGTRHLVEMFWALEELGEAGEITRRSEALGRVAAWFHDAVYSALEPADNERASAAYAATALSHMGFGARDRAAIDRLVRASEQHELPVGSGLEAAFHDADLWILSAPTERFDEYCAQVREEYAHVPDAAYATARTAILAPFLDRPRLYATTYADAQWTERGRANLERELTRLR